MIVTVSNLDPTGKVGVNSRAAIRETCMTASSAPGEPRKGVSEAKTTLTPFLPSNSQYAAEVNLNTATPGIPTDQQADQQGKNILALAIVCLRFGDHLCRVIHSFFKNAVIIKRNSQVPRPIRRILHVLRQIDFVSTKFTSLGIGLIALGLFAVGLADPVRADEAQAGKPRQPKGPSFDCAKATMDIEKAICGNEELSGLDELLAKAYRERLGMIDALVDRLKRGQPRTILEKTYGPFPEDRAMVIREQRVWLTRRNQECANKKDEMDICLAGFYRGRLYAMTEVYHDTTRMLWDFERPRSRNLLGVLWIDSSTLPRSFSHEQDKGPIFAKFSHEMTFPGVYIDDGNRRPTRSDRELCMDFYRDLPVLRNIRFVDPFAADTNFEDRQAEELREHAVSVRYVLYAEVEYRGRIWVLSLVDDRNDEVGSVAQGIDLRRRIAPVPPQQRKLVTPLPPTSLEDGAREVNLHCTMNILDMSWMRK